MGEVSLNIKYLPFCLSLCKMYWNRSLIKLKLWSITLVKRGLMSELASRPSKIFWSWTSVVWKTNKSSWWIFLWPRELADIFKASPKLIIWLNFFKLGKTLGTVCLRRSCWMLPSGPAFTNLSSLSFCLCSYTDAGELSTAITLIAATGVVGTSETKEKLFMLFLWGLQELS